MLPDGIRILRMGYGCYGLDMYVTVEIRILRIICGIFTYVFFISADVAHAKWSSLGYATMIYKDAASILIIVSSSTVDFHRSLKMERERRLVLLDCLMAIQHNQMQMNILMAKMQAILDRRKERTCWVRHWITLRPHQGAYGNLMHLLRNEDVQGFRNFTRITPAMFADMVTRLTPRLQKYDTWYRKALPVGLKVAITMRYFASGDSYHSLMYLFYVPHNTISLLVLDVCEAIYAEYGEETISNPSTPEGVEGHCPDLLRPVELPPLPGSLRWQAHPHQGTRELWLRVLQLQGVQLDCTPCPGRWQLQVPVGGGGSRWCKF